MMLYICMSVAGSIPIIVCFLLWIFQKETYNFRLGKRLLLTGMFFYLIPFQVIKYKLPDKMVEWVDVPININVEQNLYKIVSVQSSLSSGESIWVPRWLSVLSIACLCCVIVFALYQIIRYRLDIRKLMSQSEKAVIEFEGHQETVLLNPRIRSPYTVGFLKQSVIVPENSLSHSCFNMCFRHEDSHRKNHDSLMKLVCIFIICIHWTNPIAILLLFLYGVTAEYICDAYAAEDCTFQEKKSYMQLLISLSTEDEPFSMVWRNNLSGSEKLIKRRINYMMKKTGVMKRGIAVLVSAVTIFASACTILAYEPFLSTNENATEIMSELDSGSFINGEFSDDLCFEENDGIFIYEDGSQEAVTNEMSDASNYALCNHNMVTGYYQGHKANGSGGCTVYIYNAKKCSKCGYLEIGSLISTTTYVTCPH